MNTKTISIAVLALAATSVLALQHDNHGAKPEAPVDAKLVKGIQVATVTVSGGKYSPAVIKVKKGTPVEITFVGGKNIGCGSTIEIKSLKQKLTVKEGGKAVLKFTPSKAGDVAFACPMNMYKGKVVVN